MRGDDAMESLRRAGMALLRHEMMLGSQEVRRRSVKPETAGSNPAPAAKMPRYPDCVRCFGKCFQWRDDTELVQKCFWCETQGRATITQQTHGGKVWTVRTWDRRAL